MKLKTLLTVSVCACALQLRAQETNSMQQFQQRLDAMQLNFERVVAAQRAEIDSLKQQVTAMRAAPPRPLLAETSAVSSAAPSIASKPWSPSDPIRVGKGAAYMDVGMVATFAAGGSTANDLEALQAGGHDPNQRGFTVQGVELNLQGAVDPYFRGNANLLFQVDGGGESLVELEEAWLESVSLPGNLQVRAGQLLTDFGRVNTQHPHSWSFVDAPLVNARLLGGDGLRNPGARLSWLVPTPFYSELFFGVQNSHGETAHSFRNEHEDAPFLGRVNRARRVTTFSDLLYSARYAAAFDVSDTLTLLGGLSAAFGANSSGKDTGTQIYGVDTFWKWKPTNAHGGFPFVSWQSEAMLRRYEAGAYSNDFDGSTTLDAGEDVFGDGLIHNAPRETLTDWGFYSQLAWGFRPGWVTGLRGEYVGRASTANYEQLYGDDAERLGRWRVSPNLTWYPSEFSKLRLQYNYDNRANIGVDHSLWLQFEFLLGAHAAHKF
ncbi:MAG: hypothetical protein RL380_378 [Verrucomicrobiota bacterium]